VIAPYIFNDQRLWITNGSQMDHKWITVILHIVIPVVNLFSPYIVLFNLLILAHATTKESIQIGDGEAPADRTSWTTVHPKETTCGSVYDG
jgi:hypothetical protein